MSEAEGKIVSPYAEHMGFEIIERRGGFCRLACDVRDEHRNRRGTLHGGVLLGLMDHVGGLADSWTEPGEAPRLATTIDLDCRFTGPVNTGRVIATGRVIGGGRSIYFAATEVHAEDGTLVAYGSSTHKRMCETARS